MGSMIDSSARKRKSGGSAVSSGSPVSKRVRKGPGSAKKRDQGGRFKKTDTVIPEGAEDGDEGAEQDEDQAATAEGL